MDGFKDHGLWEPVFSDWSQLAELWRWKQQELKGWTASPYGHVRDPSFNDIKTRGDRILTWHQDCGGSRSMMFVWSNVCPTLVRDVTTKKRKVLKRGHIYEFNNTLFEHKMPVGALGNKERWFCRAYQPKQEPE